MTALLPALLAAATESGAGLALWAVGMSALPMAIVLHGLASLLAAGGLARRTLHDEGAKELQARLTGKVETDFDTARRLFTLICVLQMRG